MLLNLHSPGQFVRQQTLKNVHKQKESIKSMLKSPLEKCPRLCPTKRNREKGILVRTDNIHTYSSLA